MENKVEFRHLENCELRAASDGRMLTGLAIAYSQPSLTIRDRHGDYIETIMPGAFSQTLSMGADVRALYSHVGDHLLGRTSSGTLALSENSRGVSFSLNLPRTQVGNDVLELVRRGDLRGMSFGFVPMKDRWSSSGDRREVLAAELLEISVVGSPAYPQTSVAARAQAAGSESFGLYRVAALPLYEPSEAALREEQQQITRSVLAMRLRRAQGKL